MNAGASEAGLPPELLPLGLLPPGLLPPAPPGFAPGLPPGLLPPGLLPPAPPGFAPGLPPGLLPPLLAGVLPLPPGVPGEGAAGCCGRGTPPTALKMLAPIEGAGGGAMATVVFGIGFAAAATGFFGLTAGGSPGDCSCEVEPGLLAPVGGEFESLAGCGLLCWLES